MYKTGTFPFADYVKNLMEVVISAVAGDPTSLWELWDEVDVPPTLCSAYECPDKSIAVAEHSSRFTKL